LIEVVKDDLDFSLEMLFFDFYVPVIDEMPLFPPMQISTRYLQFRQSTVARDPNF